MKNPKLKIKKKIKLIAIRRFNQEIDEIIQDCLDDIRPYIRADIFRLLKKKGIIYAKTTKKNQTKKKKKK